MTYIPKYTITEKIRSNLQSIEQLKDQIRGSRILPEIEASIRLRASIEAVHSSTSIEGNQLDANQVRAAIASKKAFSKEEYAKIEVQNYKNALDYIEKRRRLGGDISLDDILELHHTISSDLLDKTRSGKIRKNPVYIENQNHEILYTAIEPKQAATALKDLINWTRTSRFQVHPVIMAAIIHFQTIAIHPFADGNGRTARALTLLYLALNQYDCNGSLVLDSYYATDRAAYYSILQLTSGKNYATAKKADLTAWIEYFTDGFLTSLHVLDAEIRMLNLAVIGGKNSELSREKQDILSYISKFGSIKISDAEEFLPEVSRRTIQRYFKELVEEKYIKKTGESKSAKYIAKN